MILTWERLQIVSRRLSLKNLFKTKFPNALFESLFLRRNLREYDAINFDEAKNVVSRLVLVSHLSIFLSLSAYLYLFLKRAIPVLFFFIFIFSITLTVNKCSIEICR